MVIEFKFLFQNRNWYKIKIILLIFCSHCKRFVDGECSSNSGDSSGSSCKDEPAFKEEVICKEEPEEGSQSCAFEANNNNLLHEDLERRISW